MEPSFQVNETCILSILYSNIMVKPFFEPWMTIYLGRQDVDIGPEDFSMTMSSSKVKDFFLQKSPRFGFCTLARRGSAGGQISDEEHHFESKADAGASKTYPQQAGSIRKNGYVVIKGRPCKVVEVSTSKTGKHGHAKCHFVALDIFNNKKLEDVVPSSHNCDIPHVNRTDYQLIDVSTDGFVSLLTENGETKDDLRLPTDDNLLKQITSGFEEGKDLVVTVMSAMGEEQICALKDIGPK
ncbi:hypothetical protein HPP92_016017 [Vanilla planifolia]|uniref:Translation initiation factor 5A C-terminal domain-containing protein n=1 Tax=Vanilla planifolia TaxID=51239 RepID=A0A835UVN2_VANPL|nr:hypothetical protein HPP92_016017 [Vanilla planifolia]